MKKIKTQCHICQHITKSETAPEFCPKCETSLANPSEETIRKVTHCSLNKGVFGGGLGTLFLTNRRVLWIKDDANAMTYGGGLVGGLIAGAVNAKSSGNKHGFAIPLVNLEVVLIGDICPR